MVKISEKTSIKLTRGDTLFLEVHLVNEAGQSYTPIETDKIYFRLKKSILSEVLIEKEIPHISMILQLDEEDTKDLPFGLYFYEIELVTEENYHFTAIQKANFEIMAELESH